MDFLALYAGPEGPTSARFSAPTVYDALDTITDRGPAWFDRSENYLNLDPDSETLADDIARALTGWVLTSYPHENYALYIRRQETRTYHPATNTAIVRLPEYQSQLSDFDVLYQAACEEWPDLPRSSCKVVHFAGGYHGGAFGLEFDAPATPSASWARVKYLPPKR